MISKPSMKYFSLVAIIASFLTITYTILKPNKVPSWTSAGVGSITFQTSTHNFNSAPWTVSFNTLAETFEKRTSRRTAAFLTKRAQELEATSNAMWTNKTIIIGKLPATPVWFLKQGSSHFGTLNSMKKVQRPKRMIGDDRDNWWSPSACNIPCVFTDATSQMLLDKKGQEKFQVNGFVQMLEDTGRVKNRALHPQHNLNGSISKDWLDGSEKKEETTKTSFRSSRMIKLKNRKNNKNQSNYNQGKNLLPVISITWEAIVPINYLDVGVPSSIYAGKFKATGGYLFDSDIYTSYGYHFLRQPWISHQWNLGNEQQFNDLMPILAVVMSHCVNWRMDYLNKLSKWFPVHFLGTCGQRPEMIEMPDGVEFDEHGRLKNIEMASQKYMFYAAFENTVQEDYVTEKVYNALGGYAIPVYIGAPNVADFIPSTESAIIATYLEPKELSRVLHRATQSQAHWSSYHAWRNLPTMPVHLKLLKHVTCDFGLACKICNCVGGYGGCGHLRKNL